MKFTTARTAGKPRGRSALSRNDIPLRITDVEDLQETVSNLDLEVTHALLSSADFEATYLLFQRILADHLYVSILLLLLASKAAPNRWAHSAGFLYSLLDASDLRIAS